MFCKLKKTFSSYHIFTGNEEVNPELKVTQETDSEDDEEEGEEAKEVPPSMPPPDKPSQPSTPKSTKYKPAATVSLITKHTNGTLNLWNVMFADKSKFGNLLNISHRQAELMPNAYHMTVEIFQIDFFFTTIPVKYWEKDMFSKQQIIL